MATLQETADPDPLAAKKRNLRAFWRTVWGGGVEPLNRPLHLFLEVTSRCNLRCAKCAMNYDPERLKAQNLPFTFLRELGPYFATALEVNTFGFGEMFLYKDLRPLVSLLKSHDCRTAGITNGTRIGPAEVQWLVGERYDTLTFSIDGATRETMARLRGADLDSILEALRLIRDEKRRQGSPYPRIVINFVVQKDNYRELPGLVQRLSELDVFFLGVNALHHFSGPSTPYNEFYERFHIGLVPRAEVEAVLEESRRLAEAAGIMFNHFVNVDVEWPAPAPGGAAPATAGPPAEPAPALSPYYCLYPWMSLYLAADKTTKVCCFMAAEENLGSFAAPSDLDGIWKGAPLQSVREHIRRGAVHPACRVCVEHHSYRNYQSHLREMMRFAGEDPEAAEEVAACCTAGPDATPARDAPPLAAVADLLYQERSRSRALALKVEALRRELKSRDDEAAARNRPRGLLRPGGVLRRAVAGVTPAPVRAWIRRRMAGRAPARP